MKDVTVYISLANKAGQLTIDGDFGLLAAFIQAVCERGLTEALRDSNHDSRNEDGREE